MSVPTVKEWLAGAGKEACRDAREWLHTLPEDATMDDAWRLCNRSDWMFWAGLRSSVAKNDPRWRQAAFAIVRRTPIGDGTCWDVMPSAAQRCVEVAEAFERGEATAEERSAACSAAESAARSAACSAAEIAAWSAAESAQAGILREFIPHPWGE